MNASSRPSQKRLANKRVFGELLGVVLERQRAAGVRLPIPVVIQDCVTYLVREALKVEGIFRIPGTKTEVASLIMRYNAGENVDLSTVSDPHVVASLFKQYLRDLPESLIPISSLQRFENWEREPSQDLFELRRILFKIPENNRKLLECVVTLLLFISKHSEENRMTVANLAVVIAPNLVRSKSGSVTVDTYNLPARLVEILIRNYGIFTAQEAEWAKLHLKKSSATDSVSTQELGTAPGKSSGSIGGTPRDLPFITSKSRHPSDLMLSSVRSLLGFLEAELQSCTQKLAQTAPGAERPVEIQKRVEAIQSLILQYENLTGAYGDFSDTGSDRGSVSERSRSSIHDYMSEHGTEYISYRHDDNHSMTSQGTINQEEFEILKDLVESQKRDIETYDEKLREINLHMLKKEQQYNESLREHEVLRVTNNRNMEIITSLSQDKLTLEHHLIEKNKIIQTWLDGAVQARLVEGHVSVENVYLDEVDGVNHLPAESARRINANTIRTRIVTLAGDLNQMKQDSAKLASQNKALQDQVHTLKIQLESKAGEVNRLEDIVSSNQRGSSQSTSEIERLKTLQHENATHIDKLKLLIIEKDKEIEKWSDAQSQTNAELLKMKGILAMKENDINILQIAIQTHNEDKGRLKESVAGLEADLERRTTQLRASNDKVISLSKEREESSKSIQTLQQSLKEAQSQVAGLSQYRSETDGLKEELIEVADVMKGVIATIETHNARGQPQPIRSPLKMARHIESLVLAMIRYLNEQADFVTSIYDELGVDPMEAHSILLSKASELKKIDQAYKELLSSTQSISSEYKEYLSAIRSILEEYESIHGSSSSVGITSQKYDLSVPHNIPVSVKSKLYFLHSQLKNSEGIVKQKDQQIEQLMTVLDATRSEYKNLSRAKSLDAEKQGDVQSRLTVTRQNYIRLCSSIIQSFNLLVKIEKPSASTIPFDTETLDRRDIQISEASRYWNAVHRCMDSSSEFAKFNSLIRDDVIDCIKAENAVESVWREKNLPREAPGTVFGFHEQSIDIILNLQKYLKKYDEAINQLYTAMGPFLTRSTLPTDVNSFQKLGFVNSFMEKQMRRLQKIETEAVRIQKSEEALRTQVAEYETNAASKTQQEKKRISDLEAEVARLKTVGSRVAEMEGIQHLYTQAQENERRLSEKYQTLEVAFANVKDKEQVQSARCRELELELTRAQEIGTKARQAQTTAEERKQSQIYENQVQKMEEALKATLAKCEQLERENTQLRTLESKLVKMKEYETEIRRLEGVEKALEVQYEQLEKDTTRLRSMEPKIRKIPEYESEIRRLEGVERALDARCQQLEKQADKAAQFEKEAGRIPSLEQEIQRLRKARTEPHEGDLERLQQLERELGRIQKLESDISKLQKVESEFLRLQTRYQTLECERDILSRESQQYRKERDIYKNSYETLQSDHASTLDSMETLRVKLKEAHAFGRKESEERTKLSDELSDLYQRDPSKAAALASDIQSKLESARQTGAGAREVSSGVDSNAHNQGSYRTQTAPPKPSPRGVASVTSATETPNITVNAPRHGSFHPPSSSANSLLYPNATAANSYSSVNKAQPVANSSLQRTLSAGEAKYESMYGNIKQATPHDPHRSVGPASTDAAAPTQPQTQPQMAAPYPGHPGAAPPGYAVAHPMGYVQPGQPGQPAVAYWPGHPIPGRANTGGTSSTLFYHRS